MNAKDELRTKACFKDANNEGQAAEFSWLPGFMVKLNAELRIAGGKRLRDCIEKEKLGLLTIPTQMPYVIPSMYHEHTHLRTLCVAEKIEGSIGRNLPISFPQTMQLLKLIYSTLDKKISGSR